jgi:hypothetical protein
MGVVAAVRVHGGERGREVLAGLLDHLRCGLAVGRQRRSALEEQGAGLIVGQLKGLSRREIGRAALARPPDLPIDATERLPLRLLDPVHAQDALELGVDLGPGLAALHAELAGHDELRALALVRQHVGDAGKPEEGVVDPGEHAFRSVGGIIARSEVGVVGVGPGPDQLGELGAVGALAGPHHVGEEALVAIGERGAPVAQL